LQCLQGALGAVFLDQAEEGIEQHDNQDGHSVGYFAQHLKGSIK